MKESIGRSIESLHPIDEKIRDKNCSISINRAAVNIPTLTLSKIGKYKYLTSHEILLTQHHIG